MAFEFLAMKPRRSNQTALANPRQYGVMDLFALMTLAALIFAMAAPFLHGLQQENRERLLTAAAFQLVVVAVAVASAIYVRGKLLEHSGRRIGIGYCGSVAWQHGPVSKSIFAMLLLSIVQLGLVGVISFAPNRGSGDWSFLIVRLQLGAFTGFAMARYLWRVYPNAMEFFENGVSLRGTTFVPWHRIDLRPSEFFDDRLLLVIRPATASRGGQSLLVQVPKRLRDAVMAVVATAKQGQLTSETRSR